MNVIIIVTSALTRIYWKIIEGSSFFHWKTFLIIRIAASIYRNVTYVHKEKKIMINMPGLIIRNITRATGKPSSIKINAGKTISGSQNIPDPLTQVSNPRMNVPIPAYWVVFILEIIE